MHKPEPPEKWWETALALIGTIFMIVAFAFALFILQAVWAAEPVEPTPKCFPLAHDTDGYCRDQRAW